MTATVRNMAGLSAELTQVVVQVLVHHHAPLVPPEPSEKGVRLGRGLLRSALAECLTRLVSRVFRPRNPSPPVTTKAGSVGEFLPKGLCQGAKLDEGTEDLPMSACRRGLSPVATSIAREQWSSI